jgi:predicted DNA-binding transcriptional regulator AlpA
MTQHATTPDQLALSAAELARSLGISERHLWKLHADGRLGPRPIALGRAKRWSVAEVQAWLAAGAPARTEWEKIRSYSTNTNCEDTGTRTSTE